MKTCRSYRIISKIETGGSDREFYRIARNGRTYIFIRGKHMSEYLAILRQLAGAGAGVPELFAAYRDRAIVEDLGDRTLMQITKEEGGINRGLYRRTLKGLVKLQVSGTRDFPFNRRYDAGHIRWEQDYFREFFLGQYAGSSKDKLSSLDRDFSILTRDVVFWNGPFDGYFMHRDFQSQNIIIKNGVPRFIDFQSARIGPLTYDLASLLKDSYLTIDKRTEDLMIKCYLGELKNEGFDIDPVAFHKAYHLAGLQRNMQALGAFANLSLNKGKPFFRTHIPRAVFLLRSALEQSPYHGLKSVMDDLNDAG